MQRWRDKRRQDRAEPEPAAALDDDALQALLASPLPTAPTAIDGVPRLPAAPATGEELTAGDRLRQRAAEYRRKGYSYRADEYERQAVEMDRREAWVDATKGRA